MKFSYLVIASHVPMISLCNALTSDVPFHCFISRPISFFPPLWNKGRDQPGTSHDPHLNPYINKRLFFLMSIIFSGIPSDEVCLDLIMNVFSFFPL